MKEKINKVETYESPKCEVMELLSEGPLLRPSLGDMGDGDDGHIPKGGDVTGFVIHFYRIHLHGPVHFLLRSLGLCRKQASPYHRY